MRSIETLKIGIHSPRQIEFQNYFFGITSKDIDEELAIIVVEIYKSAKEPQIKGQCVKLLLDKTFPFLEDFFRTVYTKSRYLDSKIQALRGLAKFVPEGEVNQLMEKFMVSLQKRPQSTPYNYQEYESLRGAHALPFLIKKYGYDCFREALKVVEQQYVELPNAFRGHYTFDENGTIVRLRSQEESSRMMSEFFERKQRNGT